MKVAKFFDDSVPGVATQPKERRARPRRKRKRKRDRKNSRTEKIGSSKDEELAPPKVQQGVQPGGRREPYQILGGAGKEEFISEERFDRAGDGVEAEGNRRRNGDAFIQDGCDCIRQTFDSGRSEKGQATVVGPDGESAELRERVNGSSSFPDAAYRRPIQRRTEDIEVGHRSFVSENTSPRDENIREKEYQGSGKAKMAHYDSSKEPVSCLAPPVPLMHGERTAGGPDVPTVHATTETDLQGQRSHNILHQTQCIRNSEAESEEHRGDDEGHNTLSGGTATMVPGRSNAGRVGHSSEGHGLASRQVRMGLERAHQRRYEPGTIVDKICATGYPGPTFPLSDGVLDPVPPGLAGRIDLRHSVPLKDAPPTCPIGKSIRLLYDPTAIEEFFSQQQIQIAFPGDRQATCAVRANASGLCFV